jgi:uncharacterized membrane protein
MEKQKQIKLLIKVGIIAAFVTLAFVGTTILRIPIPATGGYFNLGDTFVMIAALLYGPLVGLFVGMIGPTLADAIGFPQFILATAVVKAIEGFVVGTIGNERKADSYIRVTFALILGTLVIVIGYYVFEAIIYPSLARSIPFFGVTDKNAAIAELAPNCLQGFFSSLIAFGIWRVFKGKKTI